MERRQTLCRDCFGALILSRVLPSELSSSIKRDCSYPHPSIPYRGPIFCQSQHVQIHFVFPSSTNAESKSFGSFLHVHSEIIKILQSWGENGISSCLILEKLLWSVSLFSSLIVNVSPVM